MKADERNFAKTRVAHVSLSRVTIALCMAVLAFALAVALAGCGETPPAESHAAETPADDADEAHEAAGEGSAEAEHVHEHGEEAHEAMEGSDAKEGSEAKEDVEGTLEDASAETLQTTCPVMGGAIDKTYYADHNGRRIYFCCPSCNAAFEKDPEKYIKKVDEEIAAATAG